MYKCIYWERLTYINTKRTKVNAFKFIHTSLGTSILKLNQFVCGTHPGTNPSAHLITCLARNAHLKPQIKSLKSHKPLQIWVCVWNLSVLPNPSSSLGITEWFSGETSDRESGQSKHQPSYWEADPWPSDAHNKTHLKCQGLMEKFHIVCLPRSGQTFLSSITKILNSPNCIVVFSVALLNRSLQYLLGLCCHLTPITSSQWHPGDPSGAHSLEAVLRVSILSIPSGLQLPKFEFWFPYLFIWYFLLSDLVLDQNCSL